MRSLWDGQGSALGNGERDRDEGGNDGSDSGSGSARGGTRRRRSGRSLDLAVGDLGDGLDAVLGNGGNGTGEEGDGGDGEAHLDYVAVFWIRDGR